jgi:hypothetical protein
MLSQDGQQGLARELARMNLPANIYTQWYWKVDLHNLFHFLRLRADAHAQYEIRVYAEAICEVVKDWVPYAWAAFEDYRMGGRRCREGAGVLRRMLRGEQVTQETSGMSKGEWREFEDVFCASIGPYDAGHHSIMKNGDDTYDGNPELTNYCEIELDRFRFALNMLRPGNILALVPNPTFDDAEVSYQDRDVHIENDWIESLQRFQDEAKRRAVFNKPIYFAPEREVRFVLRSPYSPSVHLAGNAAFLQSDLLRRSIVRFGPNRDISLNEGSNCRVRAPRTNVAPMVRDITHPTAPPHPRGPRMARPVRRLNAPPEHLIGPSPRTRLTPAKFLRHTLPAMFRIPRKIQAIATFAFGLFLAGYILVNGRFDHDPGMYRAGAYSYINMMIDDHGLLVVVPSIVGIAAVLALLTLAMPDRRR